MKYNLVRNGENTDLTLVVDGEMYVCDGTHPNFKAIMAGILEGDESVVDLFDVSKAVAARFDRLSERVTVANGRVYFDGDEVSDSLTNQILRFMDEDADFVPLVNFFEKVASNPNEHSRKQFYDWVKARNFTITPDGDILGYKGVYEVEDGLFQSVSSGTAIVNGVTHTGQIPQSVGDVVEMPRSQVAHDPQVGCHTGLHAGTWEYASTFVSGPTAKILTVAINPRDVVSVPTDCEAQKVRVSRYRIVEVVDAPYKTALWSESDTEDENDSDGSDLCEDCGEYLCCFDDICDECGQYRF